MKTTVKLWIGIGILILLSPLGLLFPEYFKAGHAWGEWGIEEIKELAGYIPRGMEKFSGLWKAPFPDYAFRGWEEKGLGALSFAYIVLVLAGILICVCIVLLIGKLLSKKD